MTTPKAPRTADLSDAVAAINARKDFWIGMATTDDLIMALVHETDAVTIRREIVDTPDGERARYRAEVLVSAGNHPLGFEFRAISSDEHSRDYRAALGEVLCAVLSGVGPRSKWSDQYMTTVLEAAKRAEAELGSELFVPRDPSTAGEW